MNKFFNHDCDECTYLGSLDNYPDIHSDHKNWDLYFCKQCGLADTVIARYGDEGHSYVSGIDFAVTVMPLAEARNRAESLGLLDMAAWKDYTDTKGSKNELGSIR